MENQQITNNTSLCHSLWRLGIFEYPLPFGLLLDPMTGKSIKISIQDFGLSPSGTLDFTPSFLDRLRLKNFPEETARHLLLDSPDLSQNIPDETILGKEVQENQDTLETFLQAVSEDLEDREETALERYRRLRS